MRPAANILRLAVVVSMFWSQPVLCGSNLAADVATDFPSRFQPSKPVHLVGEPIFVFITDENRPVVPVRNSTKCKDWRLINQDGEVHLPRGCAGIDGVATTEYSDSYEELDGFRVYRGNPRGVYRLTELFGFGPWPTHMYLPAGDYKLTATTISADTAHFVVREPLDPIEIDASQQVVSACNSDSLWRSPGMRWAFWTDFFEKYSHTVYAEVALNRICVLTTFVKPYTDTKPPGKYQYELVTRFPRSHYLRSGILGLHVDALSAEQRSTLRDSLWVTTKYFHNSVIGDLSLSMLEQLAAYNESLDGE